jgi:hypothetical protein
VQTIANAILENQWERSTAWEPPARGSLDAHVKLPRSRSAAALDVGESLRTDLGPHTIRDACRANRQRPTCNKFLHYAMSLFRFSTMKVAEVWQPLAGHGFEAAFDGTRLSLPPFGVFFATAF